MDNSVRLLLRELLRIAWRDAKPSLRQAAILYAILLGALFIAVTIGWLFSSPAHSHDWKRPDLDGWYGSLRNQNSHSKVIRDVGCCSKDDCHETDAEMRGNDWWARLAKHVHTSDGIGYDWEPGPWVQVPVDAILLQQSNPTGRAVICHSVNITENGEVSVQATTVFCFIPPTES